MAETLRHNNNAVQSVIDEYQTEMEAIALLALLGNISKRDYQRRMVILAENKIRAVFLLAGGDSSSTGGARFLNEQIRIAKDSSKKIAADLFNGRYSERIEGDTVKQTADAGQASLFARLTLWTFVLGRAFHNGVVNRPIWLPDIMGTWHVGQTEHCSTCLAQDGVTRPRSDWQALAVRGIEPQGRGLECGGYNCQCGIEWED